MKQVQEEERSFLARLVGGPPPPPPPTSPWQKLRENVSPTAQVDKLRKKVALALDNGLVAFAVVSGVVGLITATKKARIRVKEAQMQERLRRRSRLEAVRLKVSGPMRQAAHALESRFRSILQSTKNGTVTCQKEGVKSDTAVTDRKEDGSIHMQGRHRLKLCRARARFALEEEEERVKSFFEVDCTERAVDSTLYLLCELMYWQHIMVRELQFEHVTEDDRWQFVVDSVISRLGDEFGNASNDLICSIGLESSKEMNFHFGAGMNMMLDVAKAEGVTDANLTRNVYPLRMTQHERMAIGELMRGERDKEDGHPLPLNFTAFVERNLYAEDLARKLYATAISQAHVSMDGPEEVLEELSTSTPRDERNHFVAADALDGIKKGNTTLDRQDVSMLYRWSIWVLPLRHQLITFAKFQAMDVLCLSLEELRFMTRAKFRMRRIAAALQEVLDVLDRPPDDPYFRKKNKAELKIEHASKAQIRSARRARHYWSILRQRKFEILCYARLGVWPYDRREKKKRHSLCTIM